MDRDKTTSRRQFLACLALAILTVLPLAAQDNPPPATPPATTPPAPSPPPPKSPAVKKSTLTVVVKTDDHKDLPASAKVQITFHDKTCGAVFDSDGRSASIVDGKARFDDLVVCPISIKIDVQGYLNPSKVIKPENFKPEIEITLVAVSQ